MTDRDKRRIETGDRVETINGVGTVRWIRPQAGWTVYEVDLDEARNGFGGDGREFHRDEMELFEG